MRFVFLGRRFAAGFLQFPLRGDTLALSELLLLPSQLGLASYMRMLGAHAKSRLFGKKRL
jgi:hypothetical protein